MPFDKSAKGFVPRVRTPKQVVDTVASKGIRFIDLQFTDVPGRTQHVTIPNNMLEEEAFKDGIPKLDGSSIKGFAEIFDSDMLLLPDPSTFGIIPWGDERFPTARMICDVHWGYQKGRFSRDPRYVAQKAEEAVKGAGFTESYWGPEMEFFVFDSVTWDVASPFGSSHKIASVESAHEARGTNYPIRFKEGYYPTPPSDTLQDYRSEVAYHLDESFGIINDAHHHEVATAGQCEINLYRDTLTPMGDSMVTYKYVIKNVASRRGLIATVMPKPIFGDNASGMHVSSSLWKGDKNGFYDEGDEYANLSQTGRYYVGGLLSHSRALCAITNPTTNSYRRLVPGYEAPVYVAWSRGNRSANVRIPLHYKGKSGMKGKRAEFRTPDPSANPYLAFAAIVSAGLDGVKHKIDPGDPVNEDIYELTPKKRKEMGVRELPGSLLESIESLKSDSAFLKGVFSDDLVEMMIDLEMANYRAVSARPTPYEFYLYFDI
ncbi:MAG: type I glutamate--ammonia ligase [Nitrososphaerales archaeon]